MKNIKKINTSKAPKSIGPYSQAMVVNNILYTSGQIALNLDGELVGDDIKAQSEQVMKNLEEIMKKAGTHFENTIKTTCFLANMEDFAGFNEVYSKYFTTTPARSCIAVKELPRKALIEVEVIAVI